MDGLRQYFISVISAAMICAVMSGILGKKGTIGSLIKLICGVFITLTVIKPIANIQIEHFLTLSDSYQEDAMAAVMMGEKMTEDTLSEIIKTETEAYILSKAKSLNVKVSAEVTLGDGNPPMPVSVVIRGDISPYAKGRLMAIIEEDLGITKENQLWTG